MVGTTDWSPRLADTKPISQPSESISSVDDGLGYAVERDGLRLLAPILIVNVGEYVLIEDARGIDRVADLLGLALRTVVLPPGVRA